MKTSNFYTRYIMEHSLKRTRQWHRFAFILGNLIPLIVYALELPVYLMALGIPTTYLINWYSHKFIEFNKPLSFKHPFLSFKAYFRMLFDSEKRIQNIIKREYGYEDA